MKLSMSLLTSVVLLTLSSSTFASTKQTPSCPSLQAVRNSAADQFTHAYSIGDNEWVLMTDLYKIGSETWATTYYVFLPPEIDPPTALTLGKKEFNQANLLSVPRRRINGPQVSCEFNPTDANYHATVWTEVE